MNEELAEQVAGVSALLEPARRALYLYVASQPDAVSREQAAKGADLPLYSAKFHLDRLVEEGLLDVEFRRLSGRSGPGAGRPSKLYRRSKRQLSVTLPERHYDLAGTVLAEAIERSVRAASPIPEAVRQVAEEEGRRLAEESLADSPPSGRGRAARGTRRRHDRLAATARVLAAQGYEPRVSEREICLANCPFHRMAREHTELICGMNLALIQGVIDGLALKGLTAELAPEPEFCCVKIRA